MNLQTRATQREVLSGLDTGVASGFAASTVSDGFAGVASVFAMSEREASGVAIFSGVTVGSADAGAGVAVASGVAIGLLEVVTLPGLGVLLRFAGPMR